jgi:hypothetical protein
MTGNQPSAELGVSAVNREYVKALTRLVGVADSQAEVSRTSWNIHSPQEPDMVP